jgi:anthranilate phosphoribosyltransferase
LRSFEVTPEQAGLKRSDPKDLLGGDPEYNAAAIHELFDRKPGAYRDIVLLNSAAALIVADRVQDLKSGAELAADIIDSGKAKETLARLVAVSNGRDHG